MLLDIPPVQINEGGGVEAELCEAVRAEGEECLFWPHDGAVRHLILVGVPAGGAALTVVLHVDAAQLPCSNRTEYTVRGYQ